MSALAVYPAIADMERQQLGQWLTLNLEIAQGIKMKHDVLNQIAHKKGSMKMHVS